MPLLSLKPVRQTLSTGIHIHSVTEGSGPPLVFVHGAFGDWRSWAPQWDSFTPEYRCHSYSRRYSLPNANLPIRNDHSALDDADDLRELLGHWNAAPAILVGTSYGAYVALVLALRKPSLVRALVLAEPPVMQFADKTPRGRAVREAFERETGRPAAEAFEAGDLLRAVSLLARGINGADSSAVSAEGLARRVENLNAMRSVACSTNPFPRLDEVALAALPMPILLLAGEHTPAIHEVTFAGMCQAMTSARTVRVPDAGHGAHRDNPEGFNSVVRDFLRGRNV